MIHIKTSDQIKDMQHGGKILATVLKETLGMVKPGITEIELDKFAETRIRELGCEPGFQKVPGYAHTVCLSTNDVVVHGIPGNYSLKDGDIIGVDMGVYYKGLHTDMSQTIPVGKVNKKTQEFLDVGLMALNEAIKQAQPGNRVGHISHVMQQTVEKEHGYSVVRELIGHGVGKDLHEEPEIPGYLADPIEKTAILKPGMTIAIEIIYNMGKKDIKYRSQDGWTIISKDGSLSGVFERSLAITDNGPLILTPF